MEPFKAERLHFRHISTFISKPLWCVEKGKWKRLCYCPNNWIMLWRLHSTYEINFWLLWRFCRNAVMKNCCPDWNVPALQQPQTLPPSAINGESADWTAPFKDEDDWRERSRERIKTETVRVKTVVSHLWGPSSVSVSVWALKDSLHISSNKQHKFMTMMMIKASDHLKKSVMSPHV